MSLKGIGGLSLTYSSVVVFQEALLRTTDAEISKFQTSPKLYSIDFYRPSAHRCLSTLKVIT